MSTLEMKSFENQLESLSYMEQIYVMEFLLKLMRQRQQEAGLNEKTASDKSVLEKIQGMFAEDK